MGNSKIWYMPFGSDRMAEIDFGRCINRIEGPDPVYHQTVQESLSGVQSTVIYSGRSRITLGHTWNRGTKDASGDGDLLRRRLVTLAAHLQRGGTCAFAADADYAHAGFTINLPSTEQSTLIVRLELMKNLTGALSAAGRELMVQSDHDEYKIEMKKCATNTGKTYGLAQRLATDMTDARWCLVREYYTYPALRMPKEYRQSGKYVDHDREFKFTLTLPLEEDPSAMDAYNAFGMPLPGTGHGPSVISTDPDDLSNPIDLPLYQWKG